MKGQGEKSEPVAPSTNLSIFPGSEQVIDMVKTLRDMEPTDQADQVQSALITLKGATYLPNHVFGPRIQTDLAGIMNAIHRRWPAESDTAFVGIKGRELMAIFKEDKKTSLRIYAVNASQVIEIYRKLGSKKQPTDPKGCHLKPTVIYDTCYFPYLPDIMAAAKYHGIEIKHLFLPDIADKGCYDDYPVYWKMYRDGEPDSRLQLKRCTAQGTLTVLAIVASSDIVMEGYSDDSFAGFDDPDIAASALEKMLRLNSPPAPLVCPAPERVHPTHVAVAPEPRPRVITPKSRKSQRGYVEATLEEPQPKRARGPSGEMPSMPSRDMSEEVKFKSVRSMLGEVGSHSAQSILREVKSDPPRESLKAVLSAIAEEDTLIPKLNPPKPPLPPKPHLQPKPRLPPKPQPTPKPEPSAPKFEAVNTPHACSSGSPKARNADLAAIAAKKPGPRRPRFRLAPGELPFKDYPVTAKHTLDDI
ncbi:hypothetical protein TWF281_009123 [Arthrobotrys megalospora]